MRQPAIIFDLDGTLVDSVYQHVMAWHRALCNHRILLAQWRIELRRKWILPSSQRTTCKRRNRRRIFSSSRPRSYVAKQTLHGKLFESIDELKGNLR
jgi:beta-phosphoglucomutase-like phosphatase (HAD superfamily)